MCPHVWRIEHKQEYIQHLVIHSYISNLMLSLTTTIISAKM